MRKSLISIYVIVALSIPQASGAFFETVGRGAARPVGMGEAFTSLSDDANAIWYNSAGLARINQMGIALSYARLYPELGGERLHNSVVGFVTPVGRLGSIGIGLSRLDADVTSETVGVVGYGLKLGGKLSIGGTGKLLMWNAKGSIDPVSGVKDKDRSASGFSVDLGTLLSFGAFSAGLTLHDLIQPNISESGIDDGKLPIEMRGGLLYEKKGVLFAIDFGHRRDVDKVYLGGEYRVPGSGLTLRAGGASVLGSNMADNGGVDFGLGYAFQKFILDYAYTYSTGLPEGLGTQRVSISYRF